MTVWILIVFWSGSHSEEAVGQLGPFANVQECREVAEIVNRHTATDTNDRICKEITKP